ncbi:protein-methionine-sulfoxide reductase heme-binding subunit MsrQ [Gluconacetobacter diazotrophicus]|uniref:Protein-methionine-sulfoxide reductase heme-binding subunit MsrQ n=2 Tax=Gluconacetobacter diazotrophicus TaxID=33996 RepID=A9HL04_GLUDA|nr:protein-methionine-sulfoxide reductase heme-binding subunit MsrQ [Gluconacetobacter diazotrophicus]MBB2154901.1 protein-methionine-sulfoxide reductase heme-binding subunit MsrQ [Gluconacetobacter diazotrophicus]CAP56107.1 putative membrane protein [Gluconacetobacter diazotrophicus PA1 5]
MAVSRRGPSALLTRQGLIRFGLYAVGLVPAVATFVMGATNRLGADPVNSFERTLGLWALRFLILSLCVTPLRERTGVNLLRYRRALGLLAFWYALFHLSAYVGLDQGFDLPVLLADVTRRPFIILGMVAFTILVVLAATSNAWSIRRLGRRWRSVHRWVYLAALCAAIHFILSFKVIRAETLVYALIVVGLLAYRLLPAALRRPRVA